MTFFIFTSITMIDLFIQIYLLNKIKMYYYNNKYYSYFVLFEGWGMT